MWMYDNVLRKGKLIVNIKQISMTSSQAVLGTKILRPHFITLAYFVVSLSEIQLKPTYSKETLSTVYVSRKSVLTGSSFQFWAPQCERHGHTG